MYCPLTLVIHRLFTRFTLSSTTHQHIRIKSLELTTDGEGDDLRIEKSLAQGSRTTVRSNQGVCAFWMLTDFLDNHTSTARSFSVPVGFKTRIRLVLSHTPRRPDISDALL